MVDSEEGNLLHLHKKLGKSQTRFYRIKVIPAATFVGADLMGVAASLLQKILLVGNLSSLLQRMWQDTPCKINCVVKMEDNLRSKRYQTS